MISGDTKIAKCGRSIAVEFNCNQDTWSCVKCIDLLNFILEGKENELAEMKEKFIKMPDEMAELRQDLIDYKRDIDKVHKFCLNKSAVLE